MKGTVKNYNGMKGYGFIKSDEQADDIFFHVSAYGDHEPEIGQIVEFALEKCDKGVEAKNVKIVGVGENV